MCTERYYMGVDPGNSGAVAILRDTGKGKIEVADIISCPLTHIKTGKTKIVNFKKVDETKIRIDARGIYTALERYAFNDEGYSGEDTFCIIEHAQPMPKQGLSSTAVYMEGYGKYLGVLASLNIPYVEVRSAIWKTKMGLDSNKYNSINLALELYPEASKYIKLRKDDGRAEALLLAHFGLKGMYNEVK